MLLFQLIVCGIIGVMVPFISSTRTELIAFVLAASMIHYYSRGGWSAKRVQVIGLVMALVIVAMGVLRYTQPRGIDYADYRSDTPVVKIFEPILASDNFLSVGKTAAVIDAVPEYLDYQYGRTYLLWMVAPVPRALWGDKPIVRIGLEVGRVVMGTFASGMPPGIIGELFYNFGWFGIPFGMFLAGLGLRWHYEKFGRVAHWNTNAMQIYAATVVIVAFSGLSSDFTAVVSGVLQKVVPLVIILKFIAKPEERSRVRTRRLVKG